MRSSTDNQFLAKRSDLISLSSIAIHITLVFCPVYLAAALGCNFTLPIFWLWYGTTVNGLLNLMHECAHGHTFKERSWCDFLGRWILAPLFFADFDNYRQLHWDHHRFLGSENDPKYTYKTDIHGKQFLLYFIRCMLGIEAVKKFAYQIHNRKRMTAHRSRRWLIRLSVTQFFFITSLLATTGWFSSHDNKALWNVVCAYFIVYIYGTVSLTLFMATIRAIAEHQNGVDKPKLIEGAALRNLHCGPISRLTLGCYGFAEHATHHYSPSIPSYHLQLATKVFSAEDKFLVPQVSYMSLLRQQIVQPASQIIE